MRLRLAVLGGPDCDIFGPKKEGFESAQVWGFRGL